MLFIQTLSQNGISQNTYLKIARKYCKNHGYNPEMLYYSNDNKHKLRYNHNDTNILFGSANNLDFIIVSLIDKDLANKKRNAYLKRSAAIKGDWKDNKFSKNNLARRILWNE